jgi:hypothetical protein
MGLLSIHTRTTAQNPHFHLFFICIIPRFRNSTLLLSQGGKNRYCMGKKALFKIALLG